MVNIKDPDRPQPVVYGFSVVAEDQPMVRDYLKLCRLLKGMGKSDAIVSAISFTLKHLKREYQQQQQPLMQQEQPLREEEAAEEEVKEEAEEAIPAISIDNLLTEGQKARIINKHNKEHVEIIQNLALTTTPEQSVMRYCKRFEDSCFLCREEKERREQDLIKLQERHERIREMREERERKEKQKQQQQPQQGGYSN